jgi:hypothetical protein
VVVNAAWIEPVSDFDFPLTREIIGNFDGRGTIFRSGNDIVVQTFSAKFPVEAEREFQLLKREGHLRHRELGRRS